MDTCNLVVEQALAVFGGSGGMNDRLAAVTSNRTLSPVVSFLRVSAALDSYEKSTTVRYPAATVYCTKLKNTQTERFRMFSGTATVVLEIRVSGERAEELEADLNTYVQAACEVLDASRGPWSTIGTYGGAYEVKFQATKAGGKQFMKSAQIEFEIQISR
jgi:hypothetical protein